MARSRLEAEGIDAYVQDANIVRMNWLYSLAVGGVRLQVSSEHAPEALAILSSLDSQDSGPDELSDACPECGRSRIAVLRPGRRFAFVLWLVVGFPLWRLRYRWSCLDCGHTWR